MSDSQNPEDKNHFFLKKSSIHGPSQDFNNYTYTPSSLLSNEDQKKKSSSFQIRTSKKIAFYRKNGKKVSEFFEIMSLADVLTNKPGYEFDELLVFEASLKNEGTQKEGYGLYKEEYKPIQVLKCLPLHETLKAFIK